MSHDPTLIDAFPDLVVVVRRDGIILEHAGGRSLDDLQLGVQAVGARIDSVWPPALAAPIQQLIRRALNVRSWVEVRLREQRAGYEVRIRALGPDRVLCLIRAIPAVSAGDQERSETLLEDSQERRIFDRRDFLQRFKDVLALAALRETPAAVAIIQMEGVIDVARVVDTDVAERLLAAALARLPSLSSLASPAAGDAFR